MVGGLFLEASEDSGASDLLPEPLWGNQRNHLLTSGLLGRQRTQRPEVLGSREREKISLASPFPGSWLSTRLAWFLDCDMNVGWPFTSL